MNPARRELLRLELPLGALGASIVVLALVFAVTGIPPLPAAPLAAIGIPSPLTGMTRSVVALASGDLSGSLRWHPLGPAVFVACVAAVVVAVGSFVRGHRLDLWARMLSNRWLWAVVATTFVVAWVRQIAVGAG